MVPLRWLVLLLGAAVEVQLGFGDLVKVKVLLLVSALWGFGC